MSEWKRSEDWSMLETEHAHAAASAEASRSMDTGRWCATIRIWIRDEHTCDDSFLRSPAVFVTQSEAEEWCERAITAVLPLMPATQRARTRSLSETAVLPLMPAPQRARTRSLSEAARTALAVRVSSEGVLRSAVMIGCSPQTLRRALRGGQLMRNVAQRLEAAL